LKIPSQKRAGGVVQGVGPGFKLQYRKKKYIRNSNNLTAKKVNNPILKNGKMV
jgi:hypothetical protein